MEVLLKSKMELVSLFEIDRDCKASVLCFATPRSRLTLHDFAQLFDGQQPTGLDFASAILVTAQPTPEEETFYLR